MRRRVAVGVLVAVVTILFVVTQPVFAQGPVPGGQGSPGPVPGGTSVRIPNLLGSENLIQVINRVIDAIWPVATVVVMVMVLWAAYLLMFSGGVPARVQRAKDTLLWTVVGYAIIWLAKGIAFIIQDIIVQGSGRVTT